MFRKGLDKLNLIEYIYNTNNGVYYGKKTYTQRQNDCGQNGITYLQGGQEEMKLILFVVLVLLAIFFPPILVLYALIGLIYLVKVVA